MDATTRAAVNQSGTSLTFIEVLGVVCLGKQGRLLMCAVGKVLGADLLRHDEGYFVALLVAAQDCPDTRCYELLLLGQGLGEESCLDCE